LLQAVNRFQVPTACFTTTPIPSLFLTHHSTHFLFLSSLLFTLTYEFILSLKQQQFAVTHTIC
jgi:hypothetical protein